MIAIPLPDYFKTAIEAHADEFLERANGKGFIQFTKRDAYSWWSHFFDRTGWNHYCAYLVNTNGPFQEVSA